MSIHVVYISGTYMPASGGAEISMFSLLRELVCRGLRITVVTSNGVPKCRTYESAVGIEVRRSTKSGLPSTLNRLAVSRNVDVVVTQNTWSDIALSWAAARGTPSILYARTAFGERPMYSGLCRAPTIIVANSKAVAEFVRARWNRRVSIVRSIVDVRDYFVATNSHRYITMVNPIALKGGHLFRKIVLGMPDREFLAIQGWGHLRTKSGWNSRVLKDLSAAFGRTDTWAPEEVELSGLANLRCMPTTSDMRQVYSQTRILLIPSVTAESIPRVALEAMSNGIPVLGSNVGGIPEGLRGAGIVVDQYTNPASWISAIESLDDPSSYAALCSKSRAVLSQYSPEVEVQAFYRIVANVIAR